MTDFDELKQTKAQCLADITEALPDYVNRLNSMPSPAMPATPTSWSCWASARKCD